MFTVHIKNKAPLTGFDDEPLSKHEDEDEALAAAKVAVMEPKHYSNTVLVQEEGTNRTWTVQHISGEASVVYEEGVPRLVPATDQHLLVTYDARESVVAIRKETDEDTGNVAVFLDEEDGGALKGDFKVTTQPIEDIERPKLKEKAS